MKENYIKPHLRAVDIKLSHTLLADSWNNGDLFYDDEHKNNLGNFEDDED